MEYSFHFPDPDQSPFNPDTHKLRKDAIEYPLDKKWFKNHALNTMVDNRNLELLKHPLTNGWMNYRWRSYMMHAVVVMFIFRLVGVILAAVAVNNVT